MSEPTDANTSTGPTVNETRQDEAGNKTNPYFDAGGVQKSSPTAQRAPYTQDTSIAARSHAQATNKPDPTGQVHQFQAGKTTDGVGVPPADQLQARTNKLAEEGKAPEAPRANGTPDGQESPVPMQRS